MGSPVGRAILALTLVVVAGCTSGGVDETSSPSITAGMIGVCVSEGGSPRTPVVDVGNGMDRISASFLSGTLHNCEDSATPTIAVLDAGYPEASDPALSTTNLDGLYVDADELSGVLLQVRWLNPETFEPTSNWIQLAQATDGRWDLTELPAPAAYLFEMAFAWDTGSLTYTAKVNIPDPLE